MHKAEIELLVLAFQERDKRAYALLYEHFTPRLRRYALARTGEKTLADDWVQNVWLRIHQGIKQLQDVQVFESWLYRLLRWQIMDWRKSKYRQEVDASAITTLVYYDIEPDEHGILAFLSKLEVAEREVIELHYLHDLEVSSIALLLEVPGGTVKSRLHRARHKLKAFYLSEQAAAQEN